MRSSLMDVSHVGETTDTVRQGLNDEWSERHAINHVRRCPTSYPQIWGRVVNPSMGRWHACAVNRQGAVYCWGANGYNQTGAVSDDVPCSIYRRACVREPTRVQAYRRSSILRLENTIAARLMNKAAYGAGEITRRDNSVSGKPV